MDSLGEILHLCRLCLVKDHVNIPIFDDPGNIRQIPLKISSCLPVQISRNDNLPKKICDGCSEKLDLCYEFWNSSAIAEKKLLSMVAEKENQIVEPPVPQPILMKAELVSMDNITSEQVAEEESQSEPLVPQPIVVKQEAEVLDTFESSVERTEETEAPPSKRPRRSAAIKAQKNIVPESDDDDDDEGAATEDINSEEPLTKEEPYVDEDIHTEVPDMSVDDAQPGTSGLNQGMEDSTLPKIEKVEVDPLEKLQDELESWLDNPDVYGLVVVDTFKAKSPTAPTIVQVTEEENLKKPNDNSVKANSPMVPTVAQVKEEGKLKKPTVYLQSDMYCPKCGIHCPTYYDYDKHVLNDLSHCSFSCCQCKKTAKSWLDLKAHCQYGHGLEDYYAFEKKFNIDNPQSISNYFCHYCGHKEAAIQDINQHIETKHSKWSLKCPMCPCTSLHPQSLFIHFEHEHSLINNADLECNQCKIHFYDPSAYTLHMTKVHNNNCHLLSYQCILCPMKIVGESNFLLHVHQHRIYNVSVPLDSKLTIVNGRPMYSVWKKQCLVCASMQADSNELHNHLNTVHFSAEKCFICSESNIQDMFLHLKEEHKFSYKHFKVNPVHLIAKNNQPAPTTKNSKKKNQKKEDETKQDTKICEICYGLLDSKEIADHMKNHEMRGSKRHKLRNPILDTIPDPKQCSFCSKCHLIVLTTYLKWHLRVHTTEKQVSNEQQLNPRGRDSSYKPPSTTETSRQLKPRNRELHLPSRPSRSAYRPRSPAESSRQLNTRNNSPHSKSLRHSHSSYRSRSPAEISRRRERQRWSRSRSRDTSRVRSELKFTESRFPSSRSPAESSRQINTRNKDLSPPVIHLRHSPSSYRSRSPAEASRHRRSRSRSRDTSRVRSELKCTECDRWYDTVENLVNHVKAQHLMIQPVANPAQSFMVGPGAMRMQRPSAFIQPRPLFQQRFGDNIPTPAWHEHQGVNDPGRSNRTTYSGWISRDFSD